MNYDLSIDLSKIQQTGKYLLSLDDDIVSMKGMFWNGAILTITIPASERKKTASAHDIVIIPAWSDLIPFEARRTWYSAKTKNWEHVRSEWVEALAATNNRTELIDSIYKFLMNGEEDDLLDFSEKNALIPCCVYRNNLTDDEIDLLWSNMAQVSPSSRLNSEILKFSMSTSSTPTTNVVLPTMVGMTGSIFTMLPDVKIKHEPFIVRGPANMDCQLVILIWLTNLQKCQNYSVVEAWKVMLDDYLKGKKTYHELFGSHSKKSGDTILLTTVHSWLNVDDVTRSQELTLEKCRDGEIKRLADIAYKTHRESLNSLY